MKYYIGDLCYVLSRDDHDTLVGQVYPQLNAGGADYFSPRYGRLDLGGVPVWMLGTYYGDGVYPLTKTDTGQAIAQLCVDSGTLGLAPTSVCDQVKLEGVGKRLGTVVEIDLAPADVDAHENDGVLYFSNKYSVETK